jgi:peroxiredoxin
LRGFQQRLEDFKHRGVRIVALSVDSPQQNRELREKQGYTYTFLSDEKREVIRRYDLLHAGGGPTGDIARPAEFLIDPTGTVRWANLTENYRIRPKPEDVLKVVDGIAPAPAAP